MQTPKARNCCSSETPQKVSPRCRYSETAPKSSPRSATSSEVPQKHSPRVVCKLKLPKDSDSSSSSNTIRTAIDRSSKLTERKLPKSPVPEQKKRPNKVADLESQVSELQNDLKKVKEQLDSSEEQRNKALQDAEESNKQLLELSSKLEETQKGLNLEEAIDSKQRSLDQQNNFEETIVIEDHVSEFESEIESLMIQKVVESAILDSAVNEIKELKIQLEVVAESEAAQIKQAEVTEGELKTMKESLTDTLMLVEDMKNQLGESMESEAQAKELVSETLFQLQTTKMTVVELRSDGIKTVEAYDEIASDLEQSRARVNLLDALVNELKVEAVNNLNEPKSSENEELGNLIETEVMSLKSEVNLLRSAIEATEIKYRENKTQVEEQLKSTYDMVEQSKSSFRAREAELESEIQRSRLQIEELKANLMDKETELQCIWEENEGLNVKLASKVESVDVDNLKANLLEKETEVQNILEENETLKLAIKKTEPDVEIMFELEAAKTAEREALMKLGYVTEEVDKSNRKIARVSEQIEAAQAANSEMEAELRRLKIQSEQWRKAAEAAAAMLSTAGNNNGGKYMDRTVSMDNKYNSPRSRGNASPCSEEGDNDLFRKKNTNVLKRLGILWKKPHK